MAALRELEDGDGDEEKEEEEKEEEPPAEEEPLEEDYEIKTPGKGHKVISVRTMHFLCGPEAVKDLLRTEGQKC